VKVCPLVWNVPVIALLVLVVVVGRMIASAARTNEWSA